MNQRTLAVLLLAAGVLAACSKSEPTKPSAMQRAAATSAAPAKAAQNAYKGTTKQAAEAFDKAVHALAASPHDPKAPVTAEELAVFDQHQAAQAELVAKAGTTVDGGNAVRQVMQTALAAAGPQAGKNYMLNLQRGYQARRASPAAK